MRRHPEALYGQFFLQASLRDGALYVRTQRRGSAQLGDGRARRCAESDRLAGGDPACDEHSFVRQSRDLDYAALPHVFTESGKAAERKRKIHGVVGSQTERAARRQGAPEG